jgi:hypothetical protein
MEETILPTYRLKPEDSEKFYPTRIKTISSQILAEIVANRKIDEVSLMNWSHASVEFENLANEIADSIKMKCLESLKMTRYKVIVTAYVGQKKDQGVIISSRCLWDTSTDNYVTVNFQNQHIWASVVVFGLYID